MSKQCRLVYQIPQKTASDQDLHTLPLIQQFLDRYVQILRQDFNGQCDSRSTQNLALFFKKK